MGMSERSAFGQCYGERGRLTHIGDKLQCHLCGKGFHNLGKHAQATHGIVADDYRREFMLHHGLGLVSNAYARRMSQRPQNGLLRHMKNHPRKAQVLTEFVCCYCGGPIVTRLSRRAKAPVHCRGCKAEHAKRTFAVHPVSPEARLRATATLVATLASKPRERRHGRWV